MTMSFWPELLALLIILAFASLLYIAIRTSRAQLALKTNQAENLGFRPVTAEPRELIRRVEELFRRRPDQAILVDQVYSKESWDEKEYLFDVSDAHDDDSDIGSEVFGLISSRLDLPHFKLVVLPDVFQGSGFGRLMEKLLDHFLNSIEKKQGLVEVEFPESQGFGGKMVVFGKDPDAVRDLLAGFQPPSIIPGQTPIFIAGADDFLTVDFSEVSGGRENLDLISSHNQFTQIARFFMR
jgi:hypothetical protein